MANWLGRLWNQAGKIELLTCRITEVTADLEQERWRNAQLEKQILAERKQKDKFAIDFANACGKLAGQQTLFSATTEKKADHAPDDNYSEAEIEKFTYFAEKMREADILDGRDVPPLERYVQIIKENPSQYIVS